jgi:hypothetical protein
MTDLTFEKVYGTPYDTQDIEKYPVAKPAVDIPKGAVLARDNTVTPNGWRIATAGDVGPFMVADFNGALAADLTVSAYDDGEILLKPTGAIQPGSYVIADTNGTVKADAGGAVGLRVGKYKGHPGENTGTQVATAAAANDFIYVDINKV